MGAEFPEIEIFPCQGAGDLPAILQFAERFPRFNNWFERIPELPEILRQWPRRPVSFLEDASWSYWPSDMLRELMFMEKVMLSVQYEALAEKMNTFFRDMSLRTRSEAWKRDGIGGCGADVSAFELGFKGSLSDIDLDHAWWTAYDTAHLLHVMGTREGHMACRFHAKGQGCTLEETKPPRCLYQLEQEDGAEIEALLGISIADVEDILQSMLDGTMCGKFPAPSVFCFPERNQDFVEECLARLDDMIAQVRKAPVVAQPVFEIAKPIGFRAPQP